METVKDHELAEIIQATANSIQDIRTTKLTASEMIQLKIRLLDLCRDTILWSIQAYKANGLAGSNCADMHDQAKL